MSLLHVFRCVVLLFLDFVKPIQIVFIRLANDEEQRKTHNADMEVVLASNKLFFLT